VDLARNNLLYINVFKGFLISFVIIGHAILLVVPEVTGAAERVFFGLLSKVLGPCVFGFFCFFGYSQGLGRQHVTKQKVRYRAKRMFISYIAWASIAWVAFFLLGSGYDAINNTSSYTGGLFLPIDYLVSVFTFSISWQYYFIAIFLFAMLGLLYFKDTPIERLKGYVVVAVLLEFIFYYMITEYLWTETPSHEALQRLGILAYSNPLAWVIPLIWGYYKGATKKELIENKHPFLYGILLIACFVFSVVEILFLSEKWEAFFVMDHFTVFSLLNSMMMMFLYSNCVKWLISREKGWFLELMKKFSTMGRYSIIPFYIHMPYQWFIFYFFKKRFFPEISPLPAFFIISAIGLTLSYLSIFRIKKMPTKYKRLFIGI